MANINCEICGGSRLVKQGDRFICNDCGTSYSLEDARNLLQQNNYAGRKQTLKEASGVVCPSCGSKLYLKDGYYVCLEINCNYKYPLNHSSSSDRYVSGFSEKENDEINYVGVCKTSAFSSKHIRISSKGIEYGEKFFPIETITGFQFKAVKHNVTFVLGRFYRVPMFTVPTGTTYEASFTVGGEYSFDHVKGDKHILKFNKSDYGDFINALWRVAYDGITRNILTRLKNNEEVEIEGEYASVIDTGIKVTKINMFSSNEKYFYTWDQAREHMLIKHEDGKLRIEFDDVKSQGGNLFFTLGIIMNANANILEALLLYVKNNRIHRLSDLL